MYLSAPNQRLPNLPLVKQLVHIWDLPGELATNLDTLDFDKGLDRDGREFEFLEFNQVHSNLLQVRDVWRTRLEQADTPDDQVWDQFGRYQNLLDEMKQRVAPRSENGSDQKLYLVRNPPANGRFINLPLD